MTALVRYEAARAALQAAHDVDEVKDIRDKHQAVAAYARQAQDNAMVLWASEIKVRAERRAGEMLAERKANGSRATPAGNVNPRTKVSSSTTPTLDDLGITRDQSSKWQKVAAIPDEKFEKVVEEMKDAGLITTAAVLRTATKPKKVKAKAAEKAPQKEKEKPKPVADDKALAELKAKYSDLEERYETLADTAREQEDKLTMYAATEPDEQQKLIATLQKTIQRKDAEIDRLRARVSDLNNKCNSLIQQVKIERKKRG